MSYDLSKSRELNRILWRQPKERDLGPHRFVPSFSDRATSNQTMGNG